VMVWRDWQCSTDPAQIVTDYAHHRNTVQTQVKIRRASRK
jgi:hypothetical protein